MAMTLQEISDRMEIQDVLVRYSHCIDTRNWDGLDEVFTPDAFIDYTALGGSKGTLKETQEFLGRSMKLFKSFQHMISNLVVELDGVPPSSWIITSMANTTVPLLTWPPRP